MTGNRIPPSAAEEWKADMEAATHERAERIQQLRDRLTEDFKAGKIGIENGWLFAYGQPPVGHSCGTYGCPPGEFDDPIMDLATQMMIEGA